MRYVKPRKPRGKKVDGTDSYNMCPVCLMPGCDPTAASFAYQQKIRSRINKGVCPACGYYPCRCKSSLKIKQKIMVTK